MSEIRTPSSATSHPVPVVPMFAPNTRLRPCGKLSSPALTRPMVVMVVALDDCTRSVTTAPQTVPLNDVAVALANTVRRAEPASAFRPSVITAMPRRKKPIPPAMATVVSKASPSRRMNTVQNEPSRLPNTITTTSASKALTMAAMTMST